MIAIHAGDTVRAYHARYAEVATWRPERCPRCGEVGRTPALRAGANVVVFWCYPRRKPLEAMPEPPQPIQVRRWLCTTCKHTTSMLPDILHRYRQYTWAVSRTALIRRLVLGQTWAHIQAALSQMPHDVAPAPSVDSLRRWCKAYAGYALVSLQAVLAVLAKVCPQLAQLNAHGGQVASPPQQLMPAMAALASWLSPARGAFRCGDLGRQA